MDASRSFIPRINYKRLFLKILITYLRLFLFKIFKNRLSLLIRGINERDASNYDEIKQDMWLIIHN